MDINIQYIEPTRRKLPEYKKACLRRYYNNHKEEINKRRREKYAKDTEFYRYQINELKKLYHNQNQKV